MGTLCRIVVCHTSTQRYRAESISYLDVIVALASVIGASSQVAAPDKRLGSARVSVFKTLGSGWEQAAAHWLLRTSVSGHPTTPLGPRPTMSNVDSRCGEQASSGIAKEE